MEKIIVIQTRPGIGDLCVFLPAIHEIGKNFKNYELHLLTKKRTSANEFLNFDKYIKKIIYLPEVTGLKLNKEIYKILKKENYKKCFIMHYGVRYFFLSKIAGIKDIYDYGLMKKNENIVEKSQQSISKWINKDNLEFATNVYLNFKIEKKNQITLGIGGSGLTKKWKKSNYINLAKLIYKKEKYQFLLAGGLIEFDTAQEIISTLKRDNIFAISICDKKISDTLKLLSQSQLYIGNDTGFMHLSGCIGVKSFGLFGDTPVNYSSYNNNIIPITPEENQNVTHGSRMIDSITVDHVYNYIKSEIV